MVRSFLRLFSWLRSREPNNGLFLPTAYSMTARPAHNFPLDHHGEEILDGVPGRPALALQHHITAQVLQQAGQVTLAVLLLLRGVQRPVRVCLWEFKQELPQVRGLVSAPLQGLRHGRHEVARAAPPPTTPVRPPLAVLCPRAHEASAHTRHVQERLQGGRHVTRCTSRVHEAYSQRASLGK